MIKFLAWSVSDMPIMLAIKIQLPISHWTKSKKMLLYWTLTGWEWHDDSDMMTVTLNFLSFIFLICKINIIILILNHCFISYFSPQKGHKETSDIPWALFTLIYFSLISDHVNQKRNVYDQRVIGFIIKKTSIGRFL